MPDLDRPILASRNNDRKVWVENGKSNVLSMTLQRLNASLILIIPDLDQPVDMTACKWSGMVHNPRMATLRVMQINCNVYVRIISSCDHVWLFASVVVINPVHSLLVTIQSKVRDAGSERPDLNSSVNTSRGECVGVLGVDCNAHDKVGMSLEGLFVQTMKSKFRA